MPRASIDSASASSDSPLNSLRGWSGLGRMSSTGISRSADSLPAVRVELGRMAARPRPIPRSATSGHLTRELEVCLRAGAGRIVQRDGNAEAGRLADADVARYDGLEHELGEMLAQLALDVGGEACAVVVHGDDHAGDRQPRG